MKRLTLKEIIKAAENEVNTDDWYRKKLILEKFKGMSAPTLNNYCKEMEDIEEFEDGIIKPGYSTTFVHIPTFIWFLRWKDVNKGRVKKVKPKDVLKKSN